MVRFWAGRLHPGEKIFYKGQGYVVATDREIGYLEVPQGNVPIREKISKEGTVCFNIVPLDDVDGWQRIYKKQ